MQGTARVPGARKVAGNHAGKRGNGNQYQLRQCGRRRESRKQLLQVVVRH